MAAQTGVCGVWGAGGATLSSGRRGGDWCTLPPALFPEVALAFFSRAWRGTGRLCPAGKNPREGETSRANDDFGAAVSTENGKTRRRLGARVRGSRARRWPQRRRNPVPTPHARETGECRLTSRASFSSRLRFCERVTATSGDPPETPSTVVA